MKGQCARTCRAIKNAGLIPTITKGNHIRVEHPEMPGFVVIGATPSDARAAINNRALIRRAFGITVRL